MKLCGEQLPTCTKDDDDGAHFFHTEQPDLPRRLAVLLGVLGSVSTPASLGHKQHARVSMTNGGSVEHAQTGIIQQCLSSHNLKNQRHSYNSLSTRTTTSENEPLLLAQEDSPRPVAIHNGTVFYQTNGSSNFGSFQINNNNNTIRFQVVLWYVGAIDVIQARVPVTFRVTIFWNDEDLIQQQQQQYTSNNNNKNTSSGDSVSSTGSRKVWEMRGRQTAIQREEKVDLDQNIELDVPPVSILNTVTFDTIGEPDVALLRQDTGLLRWTCMYRATLQQDHWTVHDFPHDCHDICLQLAVLAHRKPGGRWDRHVWKLGLATADDSQGSTRIPHGLVVDQVCIPEFSYDKTQGLVFAVEPLEHGPGGGSIQEQCLTVKLRVQRESSYYDRNIVPLLAMLNFVAISICALGAEEFFQRGLLTLNIAFVEIR